MERMLERVLVQQEELQTRLGRLERRLEPSPDAKLADDDDRRLVPVDAAGSSSRQKGRYNAGGGGCHTGDRSDGGGEHDGGGGGSGGGDKQTLTLGQRSAISDLVNQLFLGRG